MQVKRSIGPEISKVKLKLATGDGLAQWLEHWTGYTQRSRVRIPSGAKETKTLSCAEKVVLTSSVCPTPVCIRTHPKDHVRTLKIL